MSTTLGGSDSIVLETNVTTTNTDVRWVDRYKTGGSSLQPTMSQTWTDGTTSGKAQKHYHKTLSVTTSGTTLDLTALASDQFGTMTFSNVKRVCIRVQSPVTGVYVRVGNAASNIWSAWQSASTTTEDVYELLYRRNSVDGWTVDSSHKNLKLVASAGTLSVDVSILGS